MTSYAQGIYFRATDNQVNPANYDAEVSAAGYPWTTAQGNVVGWEGDRAVISTRDRASVTDVPLAGINIVPNNTFRDYRFDLPGPGKYNLRLAVGDSDFQQFCRVQILDGTTVLFDHDEITALNTWFDATFVDRSPSSGWMANNAVRSLNLTSSILRLRLGAESGGSFNTSIAAAYMELVSLTIPSGGLTLLGVG